MREVVLDANVIVAVRFRSVHKAESFDEHVGYARWFYGGRPFGLMQLLWPDVHGQFPVLADAPDWLRQALPLPA